MCRRGVAVFALFLCLVGRWPAADGEDPYLYFTWNVTYGTISPLGFPQQAILINGQFPGPNINSTTNDNIVVNVYNFLDEPFLLSWNGIQQRKNSWQDRVAGTNCPIPPGGNFTYHFQVKDQIGSFFYFPSVGTQKAAGGFGGLRVNSRLLIPVPFPAPADDFTVLIGDWQAKSHKSLTRRLDSGLALGRPAGVLINGHSGRDAATGRDDPPLFAVKARQTYRFRICNVGTKTSLNFRIQDHSMKLVEMDGSHTMQNNYDSLDVHLGQCMSVLVAADRPPRDYYMVASTCFTKYLLTATAVIRYAGSTTAPRRRRKFRRHRPAGRRVDGKRRYGLNGVSHVSSPTPFKLSEYFGITGREFRYQIIGDEPSKPDAPMIAAPNVINVTHRNYVEIILENPEPSVQAYHLNGYSFFTVGMGGGKWTPASRKGYNLLDAVSRHAIQVFPKSWSAIMLAFDNVGMWNLRSELLDRQYLGQQLYISVVSPTRLIRDEYNMPPNALLCGAVVGLPTPPPYS
uniref:L-ascorbate oxidase n=1 Tax=Ananas comosus var. bracteatus TaxID=296719 RepID=A0A6V7PQJ2_ANACO|nr:unnamed protein product [Ananas comosus var. bracteatus]